MIGQKECCEQCAVLAHEGAIRLNGELSSSDETLGSCMSDDIHWLASWVCMRSGSDVTFREICG